MEFRATNVNAVGPGVAERWSGADLAITADIRKGDLHVTKAILAQAKLGGLEDLASVERGLGRFCPRFHDDGCPAIGMAPSPCSHFMAQRSLTRTK